MGLKSPSRQLQISQTKDLGGPQVTPPPCVRACVRACAPPPACLRDLEAFQWSGGRSDPHVSKLTFGLESEYFCFQDLNRPSSHSKAEFLAWAAQTGQIRAIFGGV